MSARDEEARAVSEQEWGCSGSGGSRAQLQHAARVFGFLQKRGLKAKGLTGY